MVLLLILTSVNSVSFCVSVWEGTGRYKEGEREVTGRRKEVERWKKGGEREGKFEVKIGKEIGRERRRISDRVRQQ